ADAEAGAVERLGKAEMLARGIEAEGDALPKDALSEAMADLAKRVGNALEESREAGSSPELAKGLLEALAAGRLTNEQLKSLSTALASRKLGALGTLERLRAAG